MQPWWISFSILNQSIVPCLVITVASWPAYRFLRRQVRWSDIPICLRIFQFVMIHTVKGFIIVNEAKGDVFLEFPCFLHDPANVGNLIFGSSAFSKPSLYIWKFWVHILLKPSLKDFEHNLASIWNECNCTFKECLNILWHCPFWDWNENWPIPVLWLLPAVYFLWMPWRNLHIVKPSGTLNCFVTCLCSAYDTANQHLLLPVNVVLSACSMSSIVLSSLYVINS